jgi:hypothetical protein
VSPEQLVAKAEARKHVTQAPTGFGGCPPDDRPCSGSATYLIPLLPQPSTPPLAAAEPAVDNPVGSGTWEVRGQTNVPQ